MTLASVLQTYRRRYYFMMICIGLLSCGKDMDSGATDHDGLRIEYIGNGHTSGNPPIDNKTYKGKTVITISGAASLRKEGFIFNGWNTSQSGSGTAYYENDRLTLGRTDIQLYAQWLNEVGYNPLVPSNVSRIDILNVLTLPENEWYYASVDLVNGSLTLNDGRSEAKFQFQYNSESQPPSGNNGYLNIRQQNGFRTATHNGKVRALAKGAVIDLATFDDSNEAEISGKTHNWANLDRVFIPALITIADAIHFGYLEVSYNDKAGQLTLHATAYNRIPGKEVKAGDGL